MKLEKNFRNKVPVNEPALPHRTLFPAQGELEDDVIISATSITEERMTEFLQSKPYVANKVVLLTREDVADITDITTGLNDMRICSQSGTTADDLCQELLDNGSTFEYSTYEAVNLALDELTFGRVDGVMVDIVVAQYYMVQKNG